MTVDANSEAKGMDSTKGADAVDVAIEQGIDLDGSPIPAAKLDLYKQVMGLEAGRQRSGVSNTMRSRIVRIGAKHISQAELNQMLIDADFAPLKEKEIAFYYGGK
ncbi:small RNA NsiR4-regulated ssr1528 family protein [Egbenema bharatensis]|uniref:small RNA NsiR4-regulated ssr1528 family protein n=1 Tax=Egbenema bharatensis TaxID=3463334 RepID=UPI003A839334